MMKTKATNMTRLNKCILPNDKLLFWRLIDDHIIFLHRKERRLYELNKAATLIWKKAVDKIPVERIINDLSKEYSEVNRNRLQKDVVSFIKKSLEKKIFLLLNKIS